MLFVPLPFVVSILLVVLFAMVAHRDADERNSAFLTLILISAFQACLSGLRWGYGVTAVMYIAPALAAIVPPIAYEGVRRLVGQSRFSLSARAAFHAIPMVVILVLMISRRDAIDLVLDLTFLGYAAAIFRLMRPGADALRLAPFEGAVPAYRAILFTGFSLILSAGVDIFVAVDFAMNGGRYAVFAIITGNLAALLILATAAAAASRSRAPENGRDAALPKQEAEGDSEVMAAIRQLMEMKQAYRDSDLNLDRLARKVGIPARQISGAINRMIGKNVSQYVNEYRVVEACRLLSSTDKPVTEIMFESGFQTKSNFNREFRRITDMSPMEWRQKHAAAG
ncbi:helix-turn-helix domain-containing protein [Oryzifoliimicrobium ureilyticus]|uniref:helix-turn-helix domain-containing protein n=1 Tax=Oryzifoliimicrobium ureilyticus TaxID=3113724 RepID=UPI00307629ED